MAIKSVHCALVCRVYWAWHSAKCVNVAECFGLDTRQTLETLSGVLVLTLGKLYKRYRVFWNWNSAKFRNFAECFGLDTRQTWETLPSVFLSCTRQNRRHRAIPLTFFCREFIFAECLLTLGKLFAECPIKNTRQTTVCRQINAVCWMPSVTLGKLFAECF